MGVVERLADRPRFLPGDVVCWRRVRNGRVMSVTPLRVVEDSSANTVLYQAPDTAFKSARTADGGKVRDFGDWVLADLVWVGGSLLRLVSADAWHCVDIEFDAQGQFDGWKINFQAPVQRAATGFDTDDLILDLVVAPDRSWQVLDADDLHRAVADGHVPATSAARVEVELADFIGRVERWEQPFAEQRWLRWTPPSAWTSPPSLPAGGSRCTSA
jgi:hypothetical protein